MRERPSAPTPPPSLALRSSTAEPPRPMSGAGRGTNKGPRLPRSLPSNSQRGRQRGSLPLVFRNVCSGNHRPGSAERVLCSIYLHFNPNKHCCKQSPDVNICCICPLQQHATQSLIATTFLTIGVISQDSVFSFFAQIPNKKELFRTFTV